MYDLTHEEVEHILSAFRKLYTIRDLLGKFDRNEELKRRELEHSIFSKLDSK